MGIAVDKLGNDLAAAQLFNQLQRSLDGRHTHSGVKTLFKTCGSVCSHAQSLCSGSYACAVKARSLEYNVSCVVHDPAVFAAHNACNGNGLLAVGNYQHLGGKLSLNAVKSGYLLALCGISDVDGAALDVADIKCVHGVTVFQHYKVCDINKVVDGANAAGTKSFSHPQGRGTYLYVLYNACDIA